VGWGGWAYARFVAASEIGLGAAFAADLVRPLSDKRLVGEVAALWVEEVEQVGLVGVGG
jgi:hypothetical protein